MIQKANRILIGFILFCLALPSILLAQNGVKKSFNVQGTIFQPSSTNPFLGVSSIRIQILNEAATCVMYQEIILGVDTTNTNGSFSIDVGSSGTRVNNIDSTTVLGLNLFKNNMTHASITGCVGAVVIGAAESRKLRIAFDTGSGFSDMTPDIVMLSAPYAMIAETLDGHAASEFIMANTSAGVQVSQTNLETLLNNLTKFNMLNDFANSGNISGNAATATTVANNAITTGKLADGSVTAIKLNQMAATTGQVMKWDGAAWVASNDISGGGAVTSVTAAVTANNPITLAGTGAAPTIDLAKSNGSTNGYLSSSDFTTFNNKQSALGATPSFTGLTLSGITGNTLLRANGSGVLANATSADITSLLGFTPLAGSSYVAITGDTMTGNLMINSNSASANLSVTQSGAGPAATFMGGNVGIGITNPARKFVVIDPRNGLFQASFSDSTDSYGIGITSNDSSPDVGPMISVRDAGSNYRSGLTLSSLYNQPIVFSTDYSGGPPYSASSISERMRITNTGLGIGTNSPSSTLDIAGAQTLRGISLPSLSGAGQGRIYFDSTSNKFQISQNGGAYVDLLGSGGVSGSGTASSIPYFSNSTTLADSPLSVTGGNVATSGQITASKLITNTGGGDVLIGSGSSITGSQSVAIGDNASASTREIAIGYNAVATSTDGIVIGHGATTGSSSIAIGRATNASGGSSIVIGQVATTASNHVLIMGGNHGLGYITDGYFGRGEASATPNNFSFHSTGGSGTDIAGANLSLSPGAGTGTGAGGSLIMTTAPAGSTGSVANASIERMRINSNGNVGIGTTLPSYALQVSGDISVSGNFKVNGVNINSGTVTSVTSANTDIGVATGTTTPVLTLNSGTGANQILKLNGTSQIPAVSGALITSLDATNIISGTLTASRLPATAALTTGNLSQFASTTSAQLAGILSDETGTGFSVLSTSPTIVTPTFTTNITTPMIIGGTGTTSTLTYKTTTGVGATGADHIFQVGNNGGTEAMRILNNGNVGIGTTSPNTSLDLGNTYFNGTPSSLTELINKISLWNNGATPNYGLGISDYALNITAGQAAASIRMHTGGANERMRIDGNGRVGIGTVSPTTMLDVNGTANIGGAATMQSTLSQGGTTKWGSSSFLDNANSVAGNRILLTLPTGNFQGVVRVYTSRSTNDNSSVNYTVAKFNVVRTGGATGAYANFYVTDAQIASTLTSFNWYFDNTTGFAYLRFGHTGNSYTYNVVTELTQSMSAVSLAVDSGTPPTGSVVTPLNTITASTANGGIGITGGNVGIGTTTPVSTLDVRGTITGQPAVVNGTSTVDFLTGNIQYTTGNCGSFQFNNLKDGAAYTFVVQGATSSLCSFTAYTGVGTGALTVHLPADHTSTIVSKHTIYSMIVAGSHIYFSWLPGL